MSEALRKSQPADEKDWLPIDEAAELTRTSNRNVRRIALRAAARGLARQRAPRSGKGKPVWWLHRSVHPKLTRYPTKESRDDKARPVLLEQFAQHHVERAYRKTHWMMKWRSACLTESGTERAIAARIVSEARSLESGNFKISVRSLQSWWTDYNRFDANGQLLGVRALVPNYEKSDGNGSDGDGGSGPTGEARSPAAVAFFYECYHTQNRHSVKVCHELTLREAQRQGWSWPRGYSATARWLRERDDKSLTCLFREGKGAWSHKYMPYNEIDYTSVEPGEFYVCDHTQCDFWVTYKGKQIRPWLTAVLDCRSRSIVGWHFGTAPHQDAILSSFRMAFRDWAIPAKMRIDNGRDYTSKLITGVTKAERNALKRELGKDWQRALKRSDTLVTCDDTRWLGITGELEINVIYAIPYAAWSKGQVERWFGTFHGQCGKSFATYCGRSVLTRPDCLEEIKRGYSRDQRRRLKKLHGRDWKKEVILKFVDQSGVPSLDDAREEIASYIKLYHHTTHGGKGMDGQSPQAVWNKTAWLRRADADALAFLMDIRGKYKVGPNGVTLTVGATTVTYGGKCAPLKKLKGREVLIALDTGDTSVCWALSVDKKKIIARLEPNFTIPAGTTADDLREVIGEKLRDQSVMHKASRTAARRTMTTTQRIRELKREQLAELPKTGTDNQPIIRPVQTGVEGLSIEKPVQIDVEPIDDVYAHIDMQAIIMDGDVETEDDPFGEPDGQELDFSDQDDESGDVYAGIDLGEMDLSALAEDAADE